MLLQLLGVVKGLFGPLRQPNPCEGSYLKHGTRIKPSQGGAYSGIALTPILSYACQCRKDLDETELFITFHHYFTHHGM
jgi:hypothetical protein